jgi:hypothetical protein
MTRTSNDEYIAGRLINGYDFEPLRPEGRRFLI